MAPPDTVCVPVVLVFARSKASNIAETRHFAKSLAHPPFSKGEACNYCKQTYIEIVKKKRLTKTRSVSSTHHATSVLCSTPCSCGSPCSLCCFLLLVHLDYSIIKSRLDFFLVCLPNFFSFWPPRTKQAPPYIVTYVSIIKTHNNRPVCLRAE